MSGKLLEKGADFVIGHGPHMIQQIDKYGSGYSAYSIGNFVFVTEGRHREMTASPYSFILRLKLMEQVDRWLIESKFYIIVTDNQIQGYQAGPADEKEAVEAYYQIRSHVSGSAEFIEKFKLTKDKKGWYLLFRSVTPNY